MRVVLGLAAACLLSLAVLATTSSSATSAASAVSATSAAPAKPAPAARWVKAPFASPVENYAPVLSPSNIAPTPGTMDNPNFKVEVFGQPRVVKGHPCTLWDSEDLVHDRELLKTDKTLADQLTKLKISMDKRITEPLNIPVARQGPDGKWLFPGDFPKEVPPNGELFANCRINTGAITNLATAYALSGEAKYGEYCRKMLLAFAENYPKWGLPANTKWRWAYDGRLSHQFLNDGFTILNLAWSYDLIHDLPSFTADDRRKIDNFFHVLVTPFFVQPWAGYDYLSTKDNRSCICATAVLMAGYANEDQDLIDFALHGHGGTKLQPTACEGTGPLDPKEMGGTPGDKTPGGLLTIHFGEDCLLPDGLWVEGCPNYTLSIAGCGLFDAAEMLWRHGVDMYRYRNGALKRLLDSCLLLANPDPRLSVPALRDSSPFELLTQATWLNGQIGTLFNCGYQRYHDDRYLPIIRNAAEHLELSLHGGPPLMKDNLPDTAAPPIVPQNVNFYSIGYGILRIADGTRNNSLLLQFSEEKDWAGHDHPSRLGLDLYCWGDTLAPFPGTIFPYNNPLNVPWYVTTLAHNAMVVDQMSELDAGTRYHNYYGAPRPLAPQVVYAPATTLGMERACSSASSVYPGTTLDRSLFMTSRYVAELFGGFCSVTRTYDLAWHFRGTVAADLPLESWKFPEPVDVGYVALDNVRRAATDQAWSAAVTFKDKPLKFFAAAGPGTEVIMGDGYFYKDRPPTIIERRVGQKSTLFSNAIDLSGDQGGYIKSVIQEGGLDAGYGLLKIETVKGADLCFAAYRPGTYKAGGLETDAMQAMVMTDGNKVLAMYLGGGKMLKVAGATIARSEPGLAYVEKLANGTFVVGNPSPTDATVTVMLPGVAEEFKALIKAMGKVELGKTK